MWLAQSFVRQDQQLIRKRDIDRWLIGARANVPSDQPAYWLDPTDVAVDDIAQFSIGSAAPDAIGGQVLLPVELTYTRIAQTSTIDRAVRMIRAWSFDLHQMGKVMLAAHRFAFPSSPGASLHRAVLHGAILTSCVMMGAGMPDQSTFVALLFSP